MTVIDDRIDQAAAELEEKGPPICLPCEQAAAHMASLKNAPGITNVRLRPLDVSIVITALNEHEWLPRTLASIRETAPEAEIIVVDDCSDPPLGTLRSSLPPKAKESEGGPIRLFRNERRLGMARSRHIGCRLATHPRIILADAHELFKAGDIATMSQAIELLGGFIYATPNDYPPVELRDYEGLYRNKWMGFRPHGDKAMPETGIMGGLYGFRRELIDRIGGWPALPGHTYWEEAFWAIYCRKAGVPIHWLPTVNHWHLFRTSIEAEATESFPMTPYRTDDDMYLVNLAAIYRLLHDDADWAKWRAKLLAGVTFDKGTLQEQTYQVPEHVLQMVETPEMEEYGEKIRATFRTR